MRKTIYSGLLLLLVLVLFKLFFSHHFFPNTKGLAGLRQEKEVDYLFIGSSQTRQSLNTHILQDSLSKPYVLAYNDCNMYYMKFLADYVATHFKVRKIIVEAYPDRLLRAASLSDPRLFNELEAGTKIDMIAYANTPIKDLYGLLVRSSYEEILTYPFLGKLQRSLSYKGGYVNKINAGLSPESFEQLALPYECDYTTADTLQLQAMQQLIDTCKARQIALCFLDPPVPAQISNKEAFVRTRAVMRALAGANGIRYVCIDDYALNAQDPALFTDAVHLSTKGRDVYTKRIIQLVK